jgi:hypothetical protein
VETLEVSTTLTKFLVRQEANAVRCGMRGSCDHISYAKSPCGQGRNVQHRLKKPQVFGRRTIERAVAVINARAYKCLCSALGDRSGVNV